MTTQTSAQTGEQPVSDRASEVKDRVADVGSTAQNRAGDVAGTAQSRAADVAETAKDQALDIAQEAQRQARDLLGELRGQLQQQTQAQRERLVEMLREFQDELQTMADAGGRNGTATEVVRQVADRIGGIRSYVENGSNPLDDVRSFARRRPGAFLFLAATAGVLAGRATRGAAAARKQQESSGGRHVIDARDGYTPPSYPTGHGTGYTTGTSQGYATGYPAAGETTAGYRDQDGTSEGSPTFGVERTSDPNLAPTSGTLTSDELTQGDLGVVDEPVAPEYGGQGVGQPGPNAPTGNPGSGYGTGPAYDNGSTETTEGHR